LTLSKSFECDKHAQDFPRGLIIHANYTFVNDIEIYTEFFNFTYSPVNLKI